MNFVLTIVNFIKIHELVPNREWLPLKLVVFTQSRPKVDQKLLMFCSFLAFLHYLYLKVMNSAFEFLRDDFCKTHDFTAPGE